MLLQNNIRKATTKELIKVIASAQSVLQCETSIIPKIQQFLFPGKVYDVKNFQYLSVFYLFCHNQL